MTDPPTKVTSPAQAATLIGFDTLKTLVLSLQVFKSLDATETEHFSVDAMVTHCFQVATIARVICDCEGLNADVLSESFTAGLLHDLGKLIFAGNATDKYMVAVKRAQQEDIPVREAEREVFGLGHAEVGAYLMSLWGLPQGIIEGVALHHRPDLTAGKLIPATIVYLANSLAHQIARDLTETDQQVFDQVIQSLSLSTRVEQWRAKLDELEECKT